MVFNRPASATSTSSLRYSALSSSSGAPFLGAGGGSALSTTQSSSGSSTIPADVRERIAALGCGMLIVTSVTVRRINASPNQDMEYVATVTVGGRSMTTAPVRAVHDFISGWTLAFRDCHILFPMDSTYDGRAGVLVSVHSECGALQFGTVACRQPREWCALSRPRGEVLVMFHEVQPPLADAASQQLKSSALETTQGISGGRGGLRMTPLHSTTASVRPSTASALGRAPLPAPRGWGSNSGHPPVSAGGSGGQLLPQRGHIGFMGGGSSTPPSPRAPLGAFPKRADAPHDPSIMSTNPVNSDDNNPPITAAVARTVVFSDILVQDIPPAVKSAGNSRVYVSISFAHSVCKLPPVAAKAPRMHHSVLTSSEDDTNSDEGTEDDNGADDSNKAPRFAVGTFARREARWQDYEHAFEIPMVLQEPVAIFRVYWEDMQTPEGGLLFAEASCRMDIAPPYAGEKVARRVSCGGVSRCTIVFTAQALFHEPRREGASGRPTSARFPRRSSGGGAEPASTNLSSTAVLRPLSAASQRPPSAGRTRRQTPSTPPRHQTHVTGFDAHSGLVEEELPLDDFVKEDDASDDDVVAAVPPAVTAAHPLTSAHAVPTPASLKQPTSSSTFFSTKAALDEFVAAFEIRLRQGIHIGFRHVTEKLEELEGRVVAVEEKLQQQTGAGLGGTPPHSAHQPQPPGVSMGGSMSSRPSSGDAAARAHAGASRYLLPGGAPPTPVVGSTTPASSSVILPEASHAIPLYTDGQLQCKFASYDVNHEGVITREQLMHFYQTHNSFAVDETCDDIADVLRPFSRGFDSDRITFDEFCTVALRLAKF